MVLFPVHTLYDAISNDQCAFYKLERLLLKTVPVVAQSGLDLVVTLASMRKCLFLQPGRHT
jgi:hypothetical protein